MAIGFRRGEVTSEIDPTVVIELVKRYSDGETIESLVAEYPFRYRRVRTTLIDAEGW